MNVYAINPEIIREDRLPYLLKILKVKQIICLLKECPSNCIPFLLYEAKYQSDYNEEEIAENVKKAVHKFNTFIYSPKYDKGRWTNSFEVHDTFANSRACNPLYNILYCDDDNVMIFTKDSYSLKHFSNYSLNLLRKYAPNFHYESKICFVQLSYEYISSSGEYICNQFPSITSVYSQGNFYPLKRFYQNSSSLQDKVSCKLALDRSYSTIDLKTLKNHHIRVSGKYYDPLISYINVKTLELYFDERKEKNLLDFFCSPEYIQRLFMDKIAEIEEYKKEQQSYCDLQQIRYDSDYYQSELDYIKGNGGDWINN